MEIDQDEQNNIGDDLLVGAEAIAQELKWKTPRGKWNTRRVYHIAETGDLPIHRVKGLGLCARKTALRDFFAKLDQENGVLFPRD